jgi:SnoaL-like polyketide cyclase
MSTVHTTSNKMTFRRFCDAMNTGDAELISKTIDEIVQPDALIRTPLPLEATGVKTVKESCLRGSIELTPTCRLRSRILIAERDKVVSRNSVTGTHPG